MIENLNQCYPRKSNKFKEEDEKNQFKIHILTSTVIVFTFNSLLIYFECDEYHDKRER